jgi:hypothetical protein
VLFRSRRPHRPRAETLPVTIDMNATSRLLATTMLLVVLVSLATASALFQDVGTKAWVGKEARDE